MIARAERVYFHYLTREEQTELDEFLEWLKTEAISINQLEELLKGNPSQDYHFLCVSMSYLNTIAGKFTVRYKNAVAWEDGWVEMQKAPILDNFDKHIEAYIDYLISIDARIVFVLPNTDLFTFHTKNRNSLRLPSDTSGKFELAIIREFERLTEKIHELKPGQLVFVWDKK